MTEVDRERGSIVRLPDGTHLVRVYGKPYLLDITGVTCKNPDAPEEDRIYEKLFLKKRIYLPGEEALARRDILSITEDQKNVIVLGMTGYSRISEEQRKAWGLQEDAYEHACEEIIATIALAMRGAYAGVKVRFVDGASDLGVDKALIHAARRLDIPHLGHSCPEYMMHVVDDNDAVLVSPTKDTYSDEFIKSLHILCSIGGRAQALYHDLKAAIDWDKKLLLFDLIRSISSNGGGPAARNDEGKVEDATAAFLTAVHLFQPGGAPSGRYGDLKNWVAEQAVDIARPLLSAQAAFSGWRL